MDALGGVAKKVLTRLDEPSNPDDLVVDDQGMSVDSEQQFDTLSRDKLLGAAGKDNVLEKDEELNIKENDVLQDVIDVVPSIMFSSWVHEFIARRMSKMVVVKLLG